MHFIYMLFCLFVLLVAGCYFHSVWQKPTTKKYTRADAVVLAALALHHTVHDQHQTLTTPQLVTYRPETSEDLTTWLQHMYPHVNFQTQPWQVALQAFSGARVGPDIIDDWGQVMVLADYIKDYGATAVELHTALRMQLQKLHHGDA